LFDGPWGGGSPKRAGDTYSDDGTPSASGCNTMRPEPDLPINLLRGLKETNGDLFRLTVLFL